MFFLLCDGVSWTPHKLGFSGGLEVAGIKKRYGASTDFASAATTSRLDALAILHPKVLEKTLFLRGVEAPPPTKQGEIQRKSVENKGF